MVMAIGLPEDVTLWPTATKSPLGAATTQSPVNVPVEGLMALRQRRAPSCV